MCKAVTTFAVLLLLAVAYVLSYSPLCRCYYGRSEVMTQLAGRRYSRARWDIIFVPVHCLIDETPLRGPLLRWADLWGTRGDAEFDSFVRKFGVERGP